MSFDERTKDVKRVAPTDRNALFMAVFPAQELIRRCLNSAKSKHEKQTERL